MGKYRKIRVYNPLINAIRLRSSLEMANMVSWFHLGLKCSQYNRKVSFLPPETYTFQHFYLKNPSFKSCFSKPVEIGSNFLYCCAFWQVAVNLDTFLYLHNFFALYLGVFNTTAINQQTKIMGISIFGWAVGPSYDSLVSYLFRCIFTHSLLSEAIHSCKGKAVTKLCFLRQYKKVSLSLALAPTNATQVFHQRLVTP